MDYYKDGYNIGRGHLWKNNGHEYPQTESDKYSYEKGIEEGIRKRKISDEIDRELEIYR